MKTNKQKEAVDTGLGFIDFTSFEELSRHPRIINSLITDYRNIFGEPDVWSERYNHEEVLKKLQHELDGHAAIRLCVNNDSQTVVGFCWAQLLNASNIIAAIQSVNFFISYGSPEIDHLLNNIIGENPVIYIHDLGVSKSCRGTLPLEQLICPVVESISQATGTRSIFFWSVENTCVAWLAQKIGINPALSVGKMQFFKGEYPPIDKLAQLNL